MHKLESLEGLRVLITRPKHQASQLEKLILQKGGKSFVFPTLAILPPSDPMSLQKAIVRIGDYDIAIFLSANAIPPTLKLQTQAPIIIAIGTGTADALQKMGIDTQFIPQEYNSEGLLCLPILKKIKDSKIILFCGENSKPLLKDTLQLRGAKVTEAICYRRTKPTVTDIDEILNQFKNIDIIVSTSSESLLNLFDIFGQKGQSWLKSIPLLVISEKMRVLANNMKGERLVIVAPNATDQAVVETLLKYNSQRHEQQKNK